MSSLPLLAYPVLVKKKKYQTPEYLHYGAPAPVLDYEDATDWNEDSGTAADDAVNYKEGTQSVKGTAPAGATLQIDIDTPIEALGGRDLWFWVYIPDATIVGAGTFYIRVGDSGAYAKKATFYHTFVTGWQIIRVKNTDWTMAGTFDNTTAIGALRHAFDGAPGESPANSFDQLCFGSDIPAMMLMFDDGLTSVYDIAYPAMRKKNIPGTAYVVSDNIDGGGILLNTELLELHNWGWCIANHTKTHADLTTLTQAQIETELNTCKTALIAWGIDNDGPLHVAYPGGAHDDDGDLVAGMAAAGMLTGRTVHTTPAVTIPLLLPYHLPKIKNFGNTLSLAQAKTYVDGIIAANTIGPCLFHDLVETPATGEQWGIQDFIDFCAYLALKRVRVITIDELYRLQSGNVMCRKAR